MRRKGISRCLSVVLALSMVVQMSGTDLTTVYAANKQESTGSTITGADSANFDFESGLEGWDITGTVTTTDEAQDGTHGVVLSAKSSMSMTITDIAQGSYTLSSWVKGTAGSSANITIDNTGAPDAVLLLDTYMKSDSWTQTGHRNVLVYNGQMTITITAGTTDLYIDSLDLALDSQDENSIADWGFEDELGSWKTTGTVTTDTENADTGKNAVCLAAGSEISQVVSVEPNTRYSVTMRAKVTTPDTFDSKDVYYDGSTTEVEGKLVNRTSLGDRVNLGVRGIDGTVLRQAPSATEDYSLISVTFVTDSDDTQVEIYANTIYDQAYKDSVTIYKTEGTELADTWTGNGDDKVWVDNFDLFSIQDENYVNGADVSFLPVIEDNDGKYFANGVQQDCLRILANHGVNSITNMIFVQAGNPIHDPSTLEVLSNDWYYTADGSTNITSMVEGGYFDKTHSLELGERATALGMSYLPSFHYSDYWMSNAKAYTPEEWIDSDYDGNLKNTDIAHMQSIVYNYIYDFMKNLADHDVDMAGVKLGNEQNGGLAWPTGSGATSTGHAAIIAASYEAVEDAMPGISGYVHSNNGYTTSGFTSFFQALLNNEAEFDGTAFSLYGGRSSGNIITMANQSLSDETMRYMDYVNVETGFSFTKYQAVSAQQTGAMGQSAYYATSGNGQYNWLLDYMQASHDTPSPYGQTKGFYYWETDWIPTPGAGSSAGGTADICARTMFNNGDTSITEMGSTQAGKAGDMMDSMYAYLMRGCSKNKADTMQTPLRDAGIYEVDVTDPTGITLSKETLTLAEGEQERLQPTITPIDKVLSDSNITYTSADSTIAGVSHDGFVYGVKAGTTIITASVKGGYKATIEVTVTAPKDADSVTLSVDGENTTDKEVLTAEVNDKLHMTAKLSGTYDDDVVIYTSSNPEVASFFGETWQTKAGEMKQETDKDTKVQLNVKATGTTEITVQTADGSVSTSVTLNVTKTAVESVTINKSEVSISYNRTAQLEATVMPKDTTLYHVKWVSDNDKIATVDETGLVKGVGIGDAVIRAVSDDNEEVYGTCTVHVLQVQAESITLDKSSMTIQIGSTKTINALVTPDDTYDKSVTWESSDTGVATVNEKGEVTGVAAGTATITAYTAGKTYKAECSLSVQADAIPVTGVILSDSEYYFSSDYFSEANQSEETPIYRAAATVQPESATNSDVTWESDTPEVATVDSYGRITAKSAGVARITATTEEGNYTAAMDVYVPSVSESFDNYDDNDTYGMSVGAITSNKAATMSTLVTPEDTGKVLKLSASGNGGRSTQKVFKQQISNKKIIVDFDWNVGSTSYSVGNYIALTDSSNQRYLTLQMNSSTELVYGTGGLVGDDTYLTAGTAVGTGFNVDNTWYQVHVVLDMEAKTAVFTVTARDNAELTATHEVALDSATAFTGDLSAIQAYASRKGGKMSWNTMLDNLNIYTAAPIARTMTINKDVVKLLPVKDTLGCSYQLEAVVTPEAAGTGVIWTSTDESLVTISETGLITAVKTYESLAQIETGGCTVRATSVSNPELYKDVTVNISNSPNASEFFSVKDETGEIVYETATGGKEVKLESGNNKELTPVVTGGDGDTDLAAISWTSKDTDVAIIDETTGKLTGVGPGTTTITLTVTLYTGDPLTAEIPVTVSGAALAKTSALGEAIKTAKAAKEKEDYYYDTESLAAYQAAVEQAQTDYDTAVSEKWSSEKQSILDADVTALQQAVENLKLLEVIEITALTIEGADTPLSIGRSQTLTATAQPEYATEKVTWTSSNPEVAIVGKDTGRVVPMTAGTTTISAVTESGKVTATKDITVTNDLTSYYETNGVTITGTNENRKAELAFVNAQTMNLAGGNGGKNAYTTGSATTVGEIVVDLGGEANIDNVKTAFWSLLKYTIDISEDGESWTTICDHSEEAAGVLSTATEPYTDNAPEGTTARYVRLNIIENGGTGWIGVTIMQINGFFVSDTRSVNEVVDAAAAAELGSDYETALPTKVTAVFADETTEDVEVSWNRADITAAMNAAATGDYQIGGTILVDGLTYEASCKLTVTKIALDQAELHLSADSFVYDGTAKQPVVTVTKNGADIAADYYDVSYDKNTNVGTATVTVTGKGNCEGTLSGTFTITSAVLASSTTTVKAATTAYTYDGTEKKPAVEVKYNGVKLVATDYTVAYQNNVNAGTATVSVTGIGNYSGTVTAQFTIAKAAKTIKINKSSIAKKYGNSVFSLGASVTGSEKLTYTLSNSKVVKINNGKATIVGCGSVVVTVKSAATTNYNAAADKKITIKVSPKKEKLTSVKNTSSKKIVVKWAKDTKVSGYQISYSTKKNFKGAKTYTVKSSKKTSATISKLSKGKTYYVRIRGYKTVSGKKLYGSYSSVKKIKITK